MKRFRFLFASLFCLLLLSIPAFAQTVVINKYQNSGTTNDIVELLVIQNGLDMRGMILKDFSSNMANDGGGRYEFSEDLLWSNLPAGTLIVLRNDTSGADTTVGGGDFNLDVGLKNLTYFNPVGAGTFDIATTEEVMIKAAGSGDAGVTGSIHALAGGPVGTQFTNTPTPKLRATGTSGTGIFVYANNSTQTLADFNGLDATGGATGLTFGMGNNANNTAYINSLRTVAPVTEPTVQATGVQFTNVAATSATVSWTNGNGSNRLVLAKAGSPVDAAPSDGTFYPPNTAFASGAQIGSGNYAVYSSGGNSVTITGLSASTTYYFAVFEYNGTASTSDYLTANPATGNVTTAVAYTLTGNVQNSSGAGLSGVTLTLTGGATTATTTTDASGNYTFNGLTAGGSYTVTPAINAFSFTPASQSFSNLSSNQVINFTAHSKIVISEFRWSGPSGDSDEFIEISNNSDTGISVSTSDGSTGWALYADGVLRFTIPNGTTIPAHGHYLAGNLNGYSLGALAGGDIIYNSDVPINTGMALFRTANAANFNLGNRLDGVRGAADAQALYGEGSSLPSINATTAEYSFVRRGDAAGLPIDTDNNASDFVLIATDPTAITSATVAALGTPGPENLASARINISLFPSLIDPTVASSLAPNRVRQFCGDPGAPACPADPNTSTNGYLSIRRKFTNHTGTNITVMRFRIFDITTLNSPNPGGAQADLRAITSTDVTVSTGVGPVSVLGTQLESTPGQTKGGGLNATLKVTLATPLANDAEVNVQFLLGLNGAGRFRFFLNAEMVTQVPPSNSEHLVMGNPSNAVVDVNQPNNYLLDKAQYAVGYSRDKGTPNWVSWHLDTTWFGPAARQDDYRNDPSLPSGWYQVQATDYSGSGFDRGHHTPSADRTRSIPDNSATFLLTNFFPQAPDNNQGPWEVLESYTRTQVNAGNEAYIIAGGVGSGGTGSNGGVTYTVANGHVTVPAQTWKVILIQPVGTDDVSRVTTSTRVIAVVMPNVQGIRTVDWHTYRVSVDQVEALTGLDFFSNVPANIQAVIEAQVDNQP